jgi:hypothetical protein
MISASFDSTKTPLQELLASAETLLQRIEAATGKSITREPELFRAGVVAETYNEETEDEWDAEDPIEEAAP